MTTEVQDAGTATHDAGGTQDADASKTDESASTEVKTEAPAAEVDYTFETPEGVTLNEGDLKDFTAIAKELKLPKDAAQKVVDLAIARENARADAHVAQVQKWADEVKADKELGNDENLAMARKAIDLGPPELKDLLNSSGLGNHPAVVRWAFAVGKVCAFNLKRRGGNPPNEIIREVLSRWCWISHFYKSFSPAQHPLSGLRSIDVMRKQK